MQAQATLPVSPAEIKAIWWTLTNVVLPGITAGYLLTLGCAKWLHRSLTNRLEAVKTNEIAHLAARVRDLENK